MGGTVKLVSGTLVIPAAAAACSCFALGLVEQAFCQLVELAVEQAFSVVVWLCELVVSQLNGFGTETVLP